MQDLTCKLKNDLDNYEETVQNYMVDPVNDLKKAGTKVARAQSNWEFVELLENNLKTS